jgi:hypothetical protein
MEGVNELNANNSKKLTLRIGKYELAILECLSHVELDNDYKGIRKTIGLDPHELLKDFSSYIDEPGIPEQLSVYRKKAMKKILHKYQVTFTRALNRLIRKGLVYRTWEVWVKSSVDEDELALDYVGKLDYKPYAGCGVLLFYLKDRDLPKLEVKAVRCNFSLTRRGFEELSRRIPEERYSDEMQRMFKKRKYGRGKAGRMNGFDSSKKANREAHKAIVFENLNIGCLNSLYNAFERAEAYMLN